MKYLKMLKHFKFAQAPADTQKKPKMVESFSSIAIPVSGFIIGINGGRSCNFLVGKASNSQACESAKTEDEYQQNIEKYKRHLKKSMYISGNITNSDF
ncbi:MAG: hypothetical protein HQL71_02645 [Magnetococcales bacterium]|nr:hypothetical protein [Magnetococcales bacterium]